MDFLFSYWPLLLGVVILLFFGIGVFNWVTGLRRVVSANEVHIVQSGSGTVSHGKDMKGGNTYYEWPIWMPFFGIQKVVLPVSNFDLKLDNYDAYDIDRLPFRVDVMAFFRIADSNMAAQRVANFDELFEQLGGIVKSSIRSVLASHKLEEIMQSRSKFGDDFSKGIDEQLKNWGVEGVKTIEIMDIKDANDSDVIKNIMQKQKSFIQMQSRQAVAENNKLAQDSEIKAAMEIGINKQKAEQELGLRTVAAKQAVEMSDQQRQQVVAEQQKTTTEKKLEITKLEKVKAAEIEKEAQVIYAKQNAEVQITTTTANKDALVIQTEGEKAKAVLQAEAAFESAKHNAAAQLQLVTVQANGVELNGKAKAESERLLLLAPVQAQIELANKIGADEKYQNYLVSVRRIESDQQIGIAQAQALSKASVKVIANSGNANDGLKSVGELFSSGGGTKLGSMLEGFANTDAGKALLKHLGLDDKTVVVN